MPKLLLLGGPPAVGKSTVAPLLAERLAPCAWVEGDDLWRMSPTTVTLRTRRMVESNIVHVLTQQLAAGYDHVFLAWVLHDQSLIDRLLHALRPSARTTTVVHLVASPATLRTRLEHEPRRGRALDRTLDRLARIEALPYPKVDTTTRSPQEVADAVASLLLDP